MRARAASLTIEFLALASVVVFGATRGPDRMPLHWGLGGEADRVGSREQWVLESSLIGLGLVVLIVALVLVVRFAPISKLRLPNKAYWTRPQNNSRARELLLDDVVDVMGDVVLLLIAIELVAVIRARSGQLDLPLPLLLLFVALFVLSVGWRLAKLPGRYAAHTHIR